MEEAQDDSFSDWLANRLKTLQTDENVFGPYITSILEGDDDQDEKVEALDAILGELGPGIDAEPLRDEILSKWSMYQAGGKQVARSMKSKQDCITPQETDKLGDQLGQIFRVAAEIAESSYTRKHTEIDINLRAAILSKQDSDSEGEHYEPKSSTKNQGHDLDGGLSAKFGRNTNSEKVLDEQREKKEKSREESAKKKEKDKEDRAKQKKVAQERKDKAKKKATKVERKR